jgi:phosphate-selective porin OprO and OprP
MRPLLAVLLAGAAALPSPALAQPVDLAAVQEQLAAMQAEIARLTAQVAELKAREEAREAAPVPTAALAATPAPAPPPSPTIAFKGAPEITAEGGWSFKPRGRLQIDSAIVDVPSGAGNGLGTGTEFRRAYIGFEGTLPGNFGYRVEADLANSNVDLTDVYLTYKASKELTLTAGQHKPFWGLEEMTSDLFTPFMERAAFNSAFGFERRVGVSGNYAGKNLIVQLGVFADSAADLNADRNNSYSLDGRVVFNSNVAGGVLHLGGSAHFRDFNDATNTARYRARPFVHTTDVRLVDTGLFSASGERSFGGELAYVKGPFHATLEGHRITTLRPGGLSDPSFWGGYAEIGILVTPGDTTAYRGGAFDRIRPKNPLSAGGIGAIQINARYDRIDLTDGVIVGGTQQAAGLSAIWIPTDYIRFLVNYGHLWIDDPAVPAWTDPEVQVDTVGVRAQVDF